MKMIISILLTLSITICFSNLSASAAEHGGKEHGGRVAPEASSHQDSTKAHSDKEHAKEHGGKEHGGAAIQAEPTADNIKATMKAYVVEQSEAAGSFGIMDSETGKVRNLTLVRVHERVGKTGDYYYSCADFTDIDTGELLDLDIDVEYKDGNLSVVDVRIHKVGGKERYTYDENDNRVPVSN